MARLVLRVQPGARRTGFSGWFGDIPKFAVHARPVDGAANEALEVALASVLGLHRRSIHLVGGALSRTKRFEIDGIDTAELMRRVDSVNPH